MRPLAPLRSAPPSHDFPGENCAVWFAMVWYGMVWYRITCPVCFVRISTDVIACINCKMDSAMWPNQQSGSARLRPVFRCRHFHCISSSHLHLSGKCCYPITWRHVWGIRSFFLPVFELDFYAGVLAVLKGYMRFSLELNSMLIEIGIRIQLSYSLFLTMYMLKVS